MRLVLKYAKRTKSGGYIYRRRVPQDLLGIIGSREFKPALKRVASNRFHNLRP